MSQPTNQPEDQAVDQVVSEPSSASIGEAATQPIGEPASRPVAEPISRPHPVTSALCGADVDEYLDGYFRGARRTLVIGNVGFSADSAYFPRRLAATTNLDFRFFVERRPDVPREVSELAAIRIQEMETIAGTRLQIRDVDICAADGAPVGGRNACRQVQAWLDEQEYSDIVLDATGMSRGTGFPVARQLVEYGKRHRIKIHLLIGDSREHLSAGRIESISGERPDWIHGFPGKVDTDLMSAALRLWVVQLKLNAGPALNRLFTGLQTPDEVCPIVPFPATDPLSGDRLLHSLQERWIDDWGESPLSLIYADEGDPTDVYRSIRDLHTARVESLEGLPHGYVTILSPLGKRLPSIGMFLAALEYDLPVYYLETVGYKVMGTPVATARDRPDSIWCFRYLP